MLKPKSNVVPDFMGTYEAAKYCRVSYGLFMKEVNAGKIPYGKFGNHRRFSREILNAYIRGELKEGGNRE